MFKDEAKLAVDAFTRCPPQAGDASTAVTVPQAADSEADANTSMSENEPQSVLSTCDVQTTQGRASTAVSSLMGDPEISHPSTTQAAAGAQISSPMSSHSIDTDISTLPEARSERHDSEATTGSTSDNPKRSKPTSLILTPSYGETCKTTSLPTPRTAPPAMMRNPRPLPPLPRGKRQVRPLPQPPILPSYTSPVDSSSLPSASQSPSATPSSCSQAMATAYVLDQLLDQPNISRRLVVPAILTDSSSLDPLTPNIPLPSLPVAAKRPRAFKMPGEETIPDMSATSDIRPFDDIQAERKIADELSLTAKIETTPASKRQDTETSKRQLRTRIARPQAIYLLGNLSDELYDCTSVEEGCTSESSISESLNTNLELPVDVDAEEELDDKSPLFMFVEDGTMLEELDDLEEANIGWASQNVVTYQKESRVKRATRAWVLERNGQRWEEQNVLNALREL